jgi:3-hydroxy-9,10-secoandrosta-1,3,5(10)-triene-9,17-dione monooxygenase
VTAESDAVIARMIELRPELIREQAACEERTFYSQEMHEAFLDVGLYRLYVPRRYGGYESDPTTFVRAIIELARGCPSTAWCAGVATSNALQVASFWGEAAQAELFGDGRFLSAAGAAPMGRATRTDRGWQLDGTAAYCSGIPFASHYMGQTFVVGPDGERRMLAFVAPRRVFTQLDDWGDLLGLKGSGSHSIRFERAELIPDWVLEDAMLVDMDVSGGTPGLRLHGNPMYVGRAASCFTMTLASVTVGAAYNALDEYEVLLNTKKTPQPPFVARKFDHDFQRYFGEAIARIGTAEAALLSASQQHMELCRRYVDQGIPYSYGDDQRIASIAREAMIQSWEVVQSVLFRTAGSSAAAKKERFERIYRDMTMTSSHRNVALRDWFFREMARERLGLPRDSQDANNKRDGTA